METYYYDISRNLNWEYEVLKKTQLLGFVSPFRDALISNNRYFIKYISSSEYHIFFNKKAVAQINFNIRQEIGKLQIDNLSYIIRRRWLSLIANNRGEIEITIENKIVAKLVEGKRNFLFPFLKDKGSLEISNEFNLELLVICSLLAKEKLRPISDDTSPG